MEELIPPSQFTTVDDYFRAEESSPVRHEYRDGRIIAMAGGTEMHGLIATNICGEVRDRLKGSPCRVYGSDVRFSSSEVGDYSYPDTTVVCGPSIYTVGIEGRRSILNAVVIFEVLSPSTEADDRGKKFDGYREIESFQQYVLAAADYPYVQTFLRQPGGSWLMHPYIGIEAVVRLPAIKIELPMREIYANVAFPPPTKKPAAD